jgi:hypothetical protein
MKKVLIGVLVVVLLTLAVLFLKPRSAPPGDGGAASTTPASIEDTITVITPLPNTVISSPLHIEGEARGPWFFEASFPVVLVDWDGKIIAQIPAQARSDWMTNDFVPFSADVTFTVPPYGDTGALILRRDNPSGLPQNDQALEIPVRFR